MQADEPTIARGRLWCPVQVRLSFQAFEHAFNTNYTLFAFATTVVGRSRASAGVRFLTSP